MDDQLSLPLKGRKRKAPPALEFETCCALADLIDLTIRPEWRWTHLPFGEHRDHKINPKTGKRYSPTGQRLKRLGVKKGWPDYLFAGPGPSVFWLEMKRGSRGHTSAEQKEIAEFLQGHGFVYYRAQTFQDAVNALFMRGIIKSSKIL